MFSSIMSIMLAFPLSEPTCKHIRKGLEEGAVKKALVNVDWTLCQDCQAETKEKTNIEEEEQTQAQVIWLCLKCGHRVRLLSFKRQPTVF